MCTKLLLSILMVGGGGGGAFERESITDTSVEAFRTERQSAGIELIILMRKKIFVRDLQVG